MRRSGATCTVLLVLAGCGREAFEPAYNVAFVTSTAYSPFMLGPDLGAADAICEAHAAAVGYPGPFVAHIAHDGTLPADRLAGARGWTRPDGKPFVDRPVDLDAGRIAYPLRLDEYGNDVGGGNVPITNARLDAYSEGDCAGYVEPTARFRVTYADSTGAGWSEGQLQDCSVSVHVACFGTGLDTPLELPPPKGRLAFVSVQSFSSTMGIAEPEAICAQEAQLAGLSGQFLPLLSTRAQPASARFDLAGPPWVRVDGVQLAASPLALMAGELDAPLNLTAVGAPYDGNVVTGGMPGDPADRCADWTSPPDGTYNGSAQRSGRTALIATGSTSGGCGGRVYCLQQ